MILNKIKPSNKVYKLRCGAILSLMYFFSFV